MQTLQLSIIIPTYNERDNVHELFRRLDFSLKGVSWEAIFVDDNSPDGTADCVAELAQADRRARCIRRIGRRGLASASIEGMASSTAPYLAVMDADLQHDETILPTMLANLSAGSYDIVIGSRYSHGGSIGQWSGGRHLMSRLGTIAAHKLLHSNVDDPMSGFFMLRREAFLACAHKLSGQGFKILLDVLTSSPTPLKVLEIPYTFRTRFAGTSKLDSVVAMEFGFLLADKLVGRILPLRFVIFSMVGGSGVLIHLLILSLALKLGYSFVFSQSAATGIAMIYNFVLNNTITYRDARLKGWRAGTGLLLFAAVCSIGAITNVLVAEYVFHLGAPWWFAGLVGIVVVAVWNFAVTAQIVWKRKN